MDKDKVFSFLLTKVYSDKKCTDINKLNKIVDSLFNLKLEYVFPLDQEETYLLRNMFGIIADSKKISLDILELSYYKIYHYIELSKDKKDKLSSLLLYDNIDNIDIGILHINSSLRKTLFRILYLNNIDTLYTLLTYSSKELRRLKKMGNSYSNSIISAVHDLGYKFIDELSLEERKQIISNASEDVIDNSSIYWVFNVGNNYKFEKYNIGNIKELIKEGVNIPNEIIVNCLRLGIIDDKEINDNKGYLYNFIKNVICKECFSIDEDKLNEFLESLYDLSIKEVDFLNEYETYLIRKKFGIIDGKILKYDELFLLDSQNKSSLILKFKMCYEKIKYNLEKKISYNKNKRLSTLPSSSSYVNYNIGRLDITYDLIFRLYASGIFTINDLLSYSKKEILDIIGRNRFDLDNFFNIIYSFNLKFIDDLSDKEKDMIISGANKEILYNSSIYFLDSSYNLIINVLSRYYSSIGEFYLDYIDASSDRILSDEHLKKIKILDLDVIPYNLRRKFINDNILSLYDLLSFDLNKIRTMFENYDEAYNSFLKFINNFNLSIGCTMPSVKVKFLNKLRRL